MSLHAICKTVVPENVTTYVYRIYVEDDQLVPQPVNPPWSNHSSNPRHNMERQDSPITKKKPRHNMERQDSPINIIRREHHPF